MPLVKNSSIDKGKYTYQIPMHCVVYQRQSAGRERCLPHQEATHNSRLGRTEMIPGASLQLLLELSLDHLYPIRL